MRTRHAFVLVFLMTAAGGCAGPASILTMGAGPAFSAIQALTVRSVEQTVPVDAATAWSAILATLDASAIPIDKLDQSEEPWTIRGKHAGLDVTVAVTSVTPRLTSVSARVERGGLTADKETATTLLGQIDAAVRRTVAPVVESARGPESAGDIAALAGEVSRLRSVVEQKRSAPAPAAPSPAPAAPASARVLSESIVSVPISYGVPTSAVIPAPAPKPAPVPSPAIVPAASSTPAVFDPRVGALAPVAVLRPVMSLNDSTAPR